MKFLCDNCKAKYQIADEKVAGKTVRMKCRKCGHQIEVRAAVTETSVSTSLPTQGGSEAPRAAAKSSLATSLSAQKPRAPVASQPQATSALAGAFQRTVQDAPQSVPYSGAAGAGGAASGASSLELSVTDEWYVAINGVPVGPVRISELRRKAAGGAVTEDSLCWQEGLEEWRPVRSIPDLAAIVREAAQGNRPSLTAPAPTSNERPGSSPPGPRTPQRPAAAPVRSPDPPRAEPPREAPRPLTSPSRSNVVPLRVAASSTSEESAPITAPLGGNANTGSAGYAAAFAPSPTYTPAPAPIPAPVFAPLMQQAPTPMPLTISDPFAVPPAPAAAPAAAPQMRASSDSLVAAQPYIGATPSMVPPPARRAVPLWFWPILLFTGVFGAMAAVFVFRQQQQQPPVVIQMPATNAPTATEAKTAEVPAPTTSGDAPPVTSATATGKVAANPGTKPGTTVAAAATEKKGGVDVSGLLGGGTGGPNVGGGAGGPGPAAGGGLDSSSIERVVASHRAGVKRTCWERGGAGQPSANVTVSATVAPDGSVSNTSSSGDDPVVGKCIESQVKTWRFNAPGATTTVNIPFKFVRQ